jgi:hypothetical protein
MTVLPVIVLLPPIVWSLDKSIKFWVSDPVPPWLIGKALDRWVVVTYGAVALLPRSPSNWIIPGVEEVALLTIVLVTVPGAQALLL